MMAPLAADEEMLHEGAQAAFGLAEEDEELGEEPAEASGPPVRHALTSAIRRGTPSELRRDLYFHLMDGSWWLLFGTLLGAFIVFNGIFAALYLLEPNAITGGVDGSIRDAFAFSVQTMSTIGYGTLSPGTPYADLLVTAEAIVGLFGTAVATGLMFAKASRPRTSTLFSEPVLISTYHGKPTLMFRVGNARGNEIVEASISVSALMEDISPEGHQLWRMRDVKLERAASPLFVLTWQVLHVIDETSPFYGVTEETIQSKLRLMTVSLMGHDATYGQTVHGRAIYYPESFRFNHRFEDILTTLEDGRLMVDYDKFHKTIAE
jgi:inward rectifier potassium channel